MADYVNLTEFQAALANAGGAGSRTAAQLPDDRLDANLYEATAEVEGRLSRNYVLPIGGPTSTPTLLKTIIIGIAGYTATLEFYGSQPLEDRDPVVLRYARARELLALVASGQLTVEGITDKTAGGTIGDPAIYQPGPAVDLTREAPAPTYFGGYYPGGVYNGGATWG